MNFYDLVDKNIANANPVHENDYIGSDGLLYCGNCHTPKEFWAPFPLSDEKHLVTVTCACREAECQRLDELKEREEARKRREECFQDYEMTKWCFENDDRKGDTHAMQIARKYVDNFDRMYTDGVGLLIYGDVGVGKSFMAACIANALIDKGKNVYMTDFTTIIDDLWKNGDRSAYRQKLNDVALLVIDDLGRESDSEYNKGIVAAVLDKRCRSKRPLILTSNYTSEELRKTKDISLRRIYSRIFQMCIPVQFEGVDRRQMQMIANRTKYHDILGL